MVMIINQPYFPANWIWDLFLASSPQCVIALASMSTVKCDLELSWPLLSWLGKRYSRTGAHVR